MGLTSRGDELEEEQRPRQLASRRRAADLSPVRTQWGLMTVLRSAISQGGRELRWRGWRRGVLAEPRQVSPFAACPGRRGFSWHCTSGPSGHLIYTSYLAVATLGRTHGHRNLHLRTLYNKPIDTKLRIESPRRLQQISRLVVFFFFFFSIILYTYSIINPVHKLFHWFILEIADHNTHVLYVLHTGTLR